jgi:hypothetical protein
MQASRSCGCGVAMERDRARRSAADVFAGSFDRPNNGNVRVCEVYNEILAVEIASAGLYGLTDLNPRR